MLAAKEVTELLRNRGFKVTPQRLAVYEVLGQTKEHPNAEMIYHWLQPKYPTMSLATVYKTLDILSELGIIQVLNVGEECFRYDAEMRPHQHMRCTSCGRVDDVHGIDDESFIRKVTDATGYLLSERQFYFYGICPECQKKINNLQEN